MSNSDYMDLMTKYYKLDISFEFVDLNENIRKVTKVTSIFFHRYLFPIPRSQSMRETLS
jgi:hypothetical protein